MKEGASSRGARGDSTRDARPEVVRSEPPSHARLKEIFFEALELEPSEVPNFLDRACAGDSVLRGEVEDLLSRNETDTGFLSSPPTLDAGLFQGNGIEPAEAVTLPEQVASYRILDLLGWGGMGVVYLAEQPRPLRRVALKVLRQDW